MFFLNPDDNIDQKLLNNERIYANTYTTFSFLF